MQASGARDMTLVHPTVLTLAIGFAMTMLDLRWANRHLTRETLEMVAAARWGRWQLLDELERRGIVEARRDTFGDVVELTWRVDQDTALRVAVELIGQHLAQLREPR